MSSSTTYRYWVGWSIKNKSTNTITNIFNDIIDIDFEVKTEYDVVALYDYLLEQKELTQSTNLVLTLTSWPHLLGIKRNGEYRPYVTMVKLD